MLGKYDSHTGVSFLNNVFLPLDFKIENDKVYVINQSMDLENLIGGVVIAINGIDINKILEELETIISYSTLEFLKSKQTFYLRDLPVLKSLPSIDSNIDVISFKIKVNGKDKLIEFSTNDIQSCIIKNKVKNYSYEVYDNCIVVHYTRCVDDDNEMKLLIEKLKVISEEKQINNYVIDLRGNTGGDSQIIKPLLEYLRDKNIVVLVNEEVFSSARMAYVDLKRIGAYSIGTDISTSLNCFGNVPGALKLDELGLIVKRSSTYWYYDEKFDCKGYRKGEFYNYFKNRKKLLKPVILKPDMYVYLSVSDIVNKKDPQLETAINYFDLNKDKNDD